MDARKTFADKFRALMSGHDYRNVALTSRVHYTSLYNWSRGDDVPGDAAKLRAVGRVVGMTEDVEAELVELARLAKMQANTGRLIGQVADAAEENPDALKYDSDLDSADLMALIAQADPRDREAILRLAKAYLSEVRRRH